MNYRLFNRSLFASTLVVGALALFSAAGCYKADLKKSLLGVPHQLIEKFTPESQEVTDELARRLGKLMPADVFVAVTGLTTPGGSETAEKPVGTMFVSVLVKDHLFSERYEFKGSCEEVIKQTIIAAAALVISHI